MLDLTANLPDGPITAVRVAAYFDVDRRTVNTWIKKRGLEAELVCGKVYTTKAAIERFLRRGISAQTEPTVEVSEEAKVAMDRFRSRFGR